LRIAYLTKRRNLEFSGFLLFLLFLPVATTTSSTLRERGKKKRKENSLKSQSEILNFLIVMNEFFSLNDNVNIKKKKNHRILLTITATTTSASMIICRIERARIHVFSSQFKIILCHVILFRSKKKFCPFPIINFETQE